MLGNFGVSAALLTPFAHDGAIKHDMMAKHALHVLENGCSSITLFGTTGEGASLELSERMNALAYILKSNINPEHIILGIKSDAILSAIKELRAGIGLNCRNFLLAPPHFFKQVCDEGLYSWFCSVLGEFSDQDLKIILYNIPQLTGVTISPELCSRLYSQFPSLIYGVKDSSGDWNSAIGFLSLKDNLSILIGDERFLAKAVSLGAKGCISGLANFYGERLATIMRSAKQDQVITELVNIIVCLPIVPAVKMIASYIFDNQQWQHLRPPLIGLSEKEQEQLLANYKQILNLRSGA